MGFSVRRNPDEVAQPTISQHRALAVAFYTGVTGFPKSATIRSRLKPYLFEKSKFQLYRLIRQSAETWEQTTRCPRVNGGGIVN